MFTLIKREVEDHGIHFLLAVVIAATMVGLLVYFAFTEFEAALGLLVTMGVLALLACCSPNALPALPHPG